LQTHNIHDGLEKHYLEPEGCGLAGEEVDSNNCLNVQI